MALLVLLLLLLLLLRPDLADPQDQLHQPIQQGQPSLGHQVRLALRLSPLGPADRQVLVLLQCPAGQLRLVARPGLLVLAVQLALHYQPHPVDLLGLEPLFHLVVPMDRLCLVDLVLQFALADRPGLVSL